MFVYPGLARRERYRRVLYAADYKTWACKRHAQNLRFVARWHGSPSQPTRPITPTHDHPTPATVGSTNVASGASVIHSHPLDRKPVSSWPGRA